MTTPLDRALPANLEAERFVLGSILLNHDAYFQVAGAVDGVDVDARVGAPLRAALVALLLLCHCYRDYGGSGGRATRGRLRRWTTPLNQPSRTSASA